MNQLIKNMGVFTFTLALLSGCSSFPATKTTDVKNNGKVLIMPPRDVVQKGVFHQAGEESGKQLQISIQSELNLMSDYNVLVYEANDQFNHSEMISREDCINESIKLSANYCLILTLGEFRNAAPFSFRADFVTLESGFLIDVKTEKEIWSLNEPFMLDKTNLGNHLGLIDDIAKSVAESIVK